MNIIKSLFNKNGQVPSPGKADSQQKKIKLVAIAKDEALYFPEWVHHHLFFGFDEIDIYINRTTDNSAEVLEQITNVYPQVRWYSADWIDKCPQDAKNQIQFIVYNKVWDEVLREGGYSHIFFLDIDEFWIPKGFDGSIHQFLDNFTDTDVISFEWLNDLGTLPAFSSLPQTLEGNLSPLVKTIYPVATGIKELRHHVALFDGSPNHVLVDGTPFRPRKSLIQAVHEDLQGLKEAFVYHRAHRSVEEYISLLYRGRPGEAFPYKTNRHGLPTPDALFQKVSMPEARFKQYTDSLREFLDSVNFERYRNDAKQFVVSRFNQSMANLQTYVKQDYSVMMQMFRGVYQHQVVQVFSEQRENMIAQDPTNFRMIRDLAVDAASQDIQEAIRLMEKARELNPDGPIINKKLAEFRLIARQQGK
jgi:hypothetical protein